MKEETGFRTYKVGLEERKIEMIYSKQESQYWCWAASVQMVLKSCNIFVSQSLLNDILNKDKGKKCYPDCPNDFPSIAELLNKKIYNNYEFSAIAYEGEPDLVNLIDELNQNNPIIVGIWNEKTQKIGHAVVLTNIEYIEDGLKRKRKLRSKLYILDPDPNPDFAETKGRREFSGVDIFRLIKRYLVIKTKDVSIN